MWGHNLPEPFRTLRWVVLGLLIGLAVTSFVWVNYFPSAERSDMVNGKP
jgi:hypothetical protein